ncbi:hypothetical protein KBZ21_54495, partial [Streptomyces sp. A73]|nr:hypothetical protein [Streptomyces sp. A73]
QAADDGDASGRGLAGHLGAAGAYELADVVRELGPCRVLGCGPWQVVAECVDGLIELLLEASGPPRVGEAV